MSDQIQLFNDLVELITPFLVGLIVIEIIISSIRKLGYYNFKETFANVGCMMLEQATDIFAWMLLVPIFILIQQSAGIFEWHSSEWMHWVLLFLVLDLCFYCWHYAGHKIKFFWAIHSVHHQSSDYNFTVGLRNSMFHRSYVLLFYWPIPVLGFSADMTIAALVVHGAYQYVLHTRLIPPLGLAEKIFVTPSFHRVHHAKNDLYIDKNFGGMFVFWDHLFGTYQSETVEPKFGVLRQLDTHNPLKLNLLPFVKSAGEASKNSSHSQVGWPIFGYVSVQTVILFGVIILYNTRDASTPLLHLLGFWCFIIFNAFLLGKMIDQARISMSHELFRTATLLAGITVILVSNFQVF